jgi:hypothetical protein
MATRTIAHLYDTHDDAVQVVNELEAAGIPHADVSIVSNNRDNRYDRMTSTADTNAGTGAGTGATAGAVLGGGVGLLAGIGSLAIPGVGPVVAAGWLIATLAGAGVGAAAGAVAGGLIGSLTAAGVPEREANVYAEGVRRGGSLVTVRTDDTQVTKVESIMAARAPADWEQRERDFRSAGWERFDPNAPAYVPPETGLERDRLPRA